MSEKLQVNDFRGLLGALSLFIIFCSVGHAQILNKPDTLAFKTVVDSSINKLDSIPEAYIAIVDSVTKNYRQAINRIESENPIGQTREKVDSITASYKRIIEKKISDVEAKTGEFLDSDQKAALTAAKDELLKDSKLESIIEAPAFQQSFKIPEWRGTIPEISNPINEVASSVESVEAYSSTVTSIKNPEDIDQVVETQLLQVEEISEFSSETAEFAKLKSFQKENLTPQGSKEQAKEFAVNYSKEALTNQFAGKQDKLKPAFEKLNKYKGKLKSVQDINKPPSVFQNSMKGTKLRERLVYGGTVQVQKSAFMEIFLSPEIRYRLSGRFSAGIGGIYTPSFAEEAPFFNSTKYRFGMKGIIQADIFRDLYFRTEIEAIKTFNKQKVNDGRTQFFIPLVGLGKKQSLSPTFDAYLWAYYNRPLDTPYYPYTNHILLRVGFEYKISNSKKLIRKKIASAMAFANRQRQPIH